MAWPDAQRRKRPTDIEVSEEGDHLYFKVTDNGIGRKKASEMASKSATKHKSMGLKITANRIAMLQKSNGKESPVTINDIVNPDGSAGGTEVVIRMPVIEEV
jgi:LytS/YehU family sensor histidine kinase